MEGASSPHDDVRRSWLCRTEIERARFVDMNQRVATARRVQGLVISVAMLAGAPVYSPWIALVVALGVSVLLLVEKIPESRVSPERGSFASILVLMMLFGTVILLSGGAVSPYLPYLTIPTLMIAARFRLTVSLAALALSFVIAAGAVLGALALPDVPHAPGWLDVVCYLGLVTGLAALSLALLTAELSSRGDAVVDQLTGLFNRKALVGRFTEAAAQARVLGAPVALVLCDLDHFKQVNDQYGHDRGDVVLREAAYRLRKTLRTYDLVYRIGGEEFLVLLPGEDVAAAAQVAERLVADVAAESLGGLPVTMSAGAASGSDGELDLDRILKRADLALYAAKRSGRNRACADLPDGVRV